MRRVFLLISGLLVLALAGAVGPGPASARPITANLQAEEDLMISAPGQGLANCQGGVQESNIVRTNDLPTNLAENAGFALLPGSVISFVTPANDPDQIKVSFFAEARLLGAPVNAVPTDFLQIRIMLDGVEMDPPNDLAFTTDLGHANATQACKRIAGNDVAVVHTVRVEWLLVDQGANNALTGTLDDWSLEVEISD
ncbi:hypothetical protein O7627_19550 [Solwaraspora sp. WMMD1047]|uniref:hypothetical protein n=1 Tax=Solwaraspora sp. WMMD1047 TaxID=3016102 RepID=UPI0024160404|nr:hypothetical protein [Solwaraspora sp. WMMD1047]MDG4831497.1 hypothetical protein [Solwaraspora sp. WMMD1047]